MLYTFKCQDLQYQNFWWNDGLPILVSKGVKNKRHYLSTTSNGKKVDLWKEEDRSGRQRWRFVKGYGDWCNIGVTNGLNINKCGIDRAYLSTTKHGRKVDIYYQDDGSGRQRWKIVLKRDGVNIIVAGGVAGSRKYLSTTTDGKSRFVD